ncbi:MAG: hypothetical protein ACK5FE_12710, partial [Cyanobacteriota bacterium]
MPAHPVPQSVAAALPRRSASPARSAIVWPWVAVHLLLGLVWVALLAFHPFAAFAADQPPPLRLAKMLLLGGWLPSVAQAVWQTRPAAASSPGEAEGAGRRRTLRRGGRPAALPTP